MAWTNPDAIPLRSLEEEQVKARFTDCLVAIPIDNETEYKAAKYDFDNDYFLISSNVGIPSIISRDKILGYQRFNGFKR